MCLFSATVLFLISFCFLCFSSLSLSLSLSLLFSRQYNQVIFLHYHRFNLQHKLLSNVNLYDVALSASAMLANWCSPGKHVRNVARPSCTVERETVYVVVVVVVVVFGSVRICSFVPVHARLICIFSMWLCMYVCVCMCVCVCVCVCVCEHV
jgi:Acidic fibroblast growth factor binding (FIBP)